MKIRLTSIALLVLAACNSQTTSSSDMGAVDLGAADTGTADTGPLDMMTVGDAGNSLCVDYCNVAMATCTGALALYADTPTCLTACAMFPTTGAPDAASGDSIQCRMHHLGLAAMGVSYAEDHCPHAAPDGGGICSAP